MPAPGTSTLPAILALLLCLVTSSRGADSAPKIDFNHDIRPILSENCFLCHGPDESERKADLRLDLRADALEPAKSGARAVVPGKPEQSELLARIAHQDPDELMPPAKSGKKLSAAQIDTLRRWIEQGADYDTHWSYAKPVRPPLPAVQRTDWPRNGLDYFILARLEREGLSPSPEADRHTLARRLALDLTGLPPTLAEIEEFVNDPGNDAYLKYVDRMLAKKSFGEHWARMWLDLARYADSAGYADDPLRTIWGFRDYVIKSFNKNKPFDQFTIEQIAGDLLENPAEEQLIATAFHRNTMTNSEGGTNDEEFRNEAVVDRVNTTMAVWMGTSMACAQCHTHKYDPISQTEYFQFLAFLNNTEDADKRDESPLLEFFTPLEKEKRADLQARIDSLEKILATPTPELEADFGKWESSFPRELDWQPLKPAKVDYNRDAKVEVKDDGRVRVDAAAKETYTLELPLPGAQLAALRIESLPDEKLPGKGAGHGSGGSFMVSRISALLVPPGSASVFGRFVRIELPGKEKILSLAEVQVFNGSDNIAPTGQASQSSTDYEAEASRAIDRKTNGDFKANSTTHTSNSENPWWELDLKDAREINRIVIWNRTDNDLQKRLKDFRVTLLDADRNIVWERQLSEAPDPSIELAVDGTKLIRFAVAYPDRMDEGSDPASVLSAKTDPKKGWFVPPDQTDPRWLTLLPDELITFAEGAKLKVIIDQHSERKQQSLGSFRLLATPNADLIPYHNASPAMLALLSRDHSEEEKTTLLKYYLRDLAPGLKEERARVAALEKELNGIKPNTVPILRELAGDKRRKTHLQYRGSFMDLGDEVHEAVPAVFHPLPENAPKNRLGLAKWLVDEKNPLTARVMANRFWEQIFGVGLVITSEEFGAQGELPSHPELLDWLAVEFQQDWNVKEFLKLLVTSATYRQSSRVTPELIERDPDNRLLARGPRFRMSAEMVRDQALALAGLLSPKLHGPSVKPPRPTSGLNAAFGSSIDWKTSEGEDRFRRGLYTEWRRTSPYPSMVTFDAPNREVCTLRRNRTNTPLQALVTLNDPVYLEAAQGLARRMAGQSGSPEAKLRYGFQLCVARPPSGRELDRLATLFEAARAEFADDKKAAEQIATEPIGAPPEGSDLVELAALTTVANVLLNLDETLMKP